MNYSLKHEAFYDAMIKEMLQYAGFQESVAVMLRAMGSYISGKKRTIVDDLYQIYSDQQVIDD
jgi:hypothetical protein